jgi:periplasmic divalent cation tolerance protein
MSAEPSARVPVIVFVTWPADRDPTPFAKALVEARLVACANVLPEMRSVYTWEGAVHEDAERQIILKTTAERLPALESRVRELHPYAVPEFLAVPVMSGSADYLRWLRESTALA